MYLKFLISFLIIATLAGSINIYGQCINGTDSYPIYKKGAKLVSEFDEQGAEIVRIEYDLVFDSKESFRNLSADWEYAIIGFADDGVKDLDVKVYEYDDLLESWTLVAEDKSTEAYAFTSIQPEESGLYKVEVIVYEFHEGYSAARYGLIFVHD